MSPTPFVARLDAVRDRMVSLGVDALALSVGPDLPWLTGYEAMPLERLTMLVVTTDDTPTLVVPALEAPRVREWGHFGLRPWTEAEDPVGIVGELVGRARRVAVGDRTWGRFVIELGAALPSATLERANDVTGPLRAIKDDHERTMLHAAGAVVDAIAADLREGRIPLAGRTEAEVSADLGARIVDGGHHRVNFAIVAAGANAASPHHEAGSRVIEAGDGVLCDFGGTMLDEWGVGYCSDITRCVWLGEPPADAVDAYEVLRAAQAAGVASATVGVSCASVDDVCRSAIDAAGYGEYFIHRTGHGIGVEEHEDPYIVETNPTPLADGHAFSIEPGIYVPGGFGFRIEDCLLATVAGPDPFTLTGHDLAVVDA